MIKNYSCHDPAVAPPWRGHLADTIEVGAGRILFEIADRVGHTRGQVPVGCAQRIHRALFQLKSRVLAPVCEERRRPLRAQVDDPRRATERERRHNVRHIDLVTRPM